MVAKNELVTDVHAISCAVLDENVDLHLVRPFITSAAWSGLLSLQAQKKEGHMWMCGECKCDL